MNSNPNTPNGDKANLEEVYKMLPAGIQIEVRNLIMKHCGWTSVPTFHNKRKGITCIRPVEAEAIERQFAVYGLDPWTGAKITDHVAY